MTDRSPTLLWLRRDLRLSDHPALAAAVQRRGPVIPVFIHDDSVARLGAAPKWRMGLSLADLAARLEQMGSRLILRRGPAQQVLDELIGETGAGAVHWSRLYDPHAIERDTRIKAHLKDQGIAAESHPGHVLFEPWTVATQAGGFYKVFTPMWRAVKDRDVPDPLTAPPQIPAPEKWPGSDDLDDWQMGRAMNRGAGVCLAHQRVGEAAAQERLGWFTGHAIDGYAAARDRPGVQGTSGLSQNLTCGEISPRQCWHAGQRAGVGGAAGAETWLKELVWREFATHLMYHTPHILDANWREEWNGFAWRDDERLTEVKAWKRGRTGVPFVDAAMREMYVTGTMHNRARMIVASYLTKHLLIHWRVGQAWFADCLTDWDAASNAMGWQWAAGSGPDAAPYFRVFNPQTQLDRFDPGHAYTKAWIAEGQADPPATALSYFDAVPQSWGMGAKDAYPAPLLTLAEGRARALAAYQARDV